MGVWEEHDWNSMRALNGKLLALFASVPFLYFSYDLIMTCPADSFFSGANWHVFETKCGLGTNFGALVLALVYVPMYLLSIVQGNGWLNDLYWTVIPLLAMFHYHVMAIRFHPHLNAFRLGLVWGVLLLWSGRLTYNYIRREEWTFGAREDFRFEKMRADYGKHWIWVSFFAQFLSQHITETLFTVPYYFAVQSSAPIDWIDAACLFGALICLFVAGIADNQLREWVSNSKNRGKVLRSGLWAYSRHPNYAAESTFHWMLGFWALRTSPTLWILVCPAFNTLILIITTGLTEANSLRGPKRAQYLKYQQEVRVW